MTCMCSSPDCRVNGCRAMRSLTNPTYTFPATIPQGWVCPSCSTVYAPNVTSCSCRKGSKA